VSILFERQNELICGRAARLRSCVDAQPDSDISAYTYERTLLMEQRHAMLAQMKIKKKNSLTVGH